MRQIKNHTLSLTGYTAPRVHIDLQQWVDDQLKKSGGRLISLDTHVILTHSTVMGPVTNHESTLLAILTLEVPGPESLITPGPDSISN